MRTDDLIDALAAGLEPVRPARIHPLWIVGALAASVVGVLLMLGLRPDLTVAMTGWAFWLKALYSTAIAGAALMLVTRLGRPGVNSRPALYAVLGIVGVAIAFAGVELALTPSGDWTRSWLGLTWTLCARNILLMSVFAAPLIWLGARPLAPTRPMASGAALGLLTGAIAATAYGLHCPEATAPFVATWYTLGMALAAAIGAVIGRFALRW
ncbi:NrsF family protein [Brevundimonas sp.]|uniref:NrsF family protein n=1 Tax=Brevundimonas sp. TaxID=1871086 RepID=UPI003AF77FBE